MFVNTADELSGHWGLGRFTLRVGQGGVGLVALLEGDTHSLHPSGSDVLNTTNAHTYI